MRPPPSSLQRKHETKMIVHQADRLHMRVHRRGSDEEKPRFLRSEARASEVSVVVGTLDRFFQEFTMGCPATKRQI